MEARVKATGEIVDVYESCNEDFPWTDEMGDEIWKTEELMFLETADNTHDYWTRLEHQYAGMAMQAMVQDGSNIVLLDGEDRYTKLARRAHDIATALVKELKEEK